MRKNPSSEQREATMYLFVIALVSLITATAAASADAQTQLTFVPSVSISSVYDDNLFASTQGDAGHMNRLRPSLQTVYDSPTLKLDSALSFDMQQSNHVALNSFDARRHGSFESHLRSSPFTTLGLAAYYDRTETPGELNLFTGVLGERQRAQRWEVVPSFSYRFRPRTTMHANYDWTTESLVSAMEGTLHVLRAGVVHQWSTRTELTAGYLGRRFTDPVGVNMSHALLFGWNRELAPSTRLTVQMGPRAATYSGLDPEIVIGVGRGLPTDPGVKFAAEYWHGETIILGIRGPVAVDSATMRFVVPLTRKIEVGTHVGASDSTTLAGEDARVYRTTFIGSWSPGDLYTVSASYGVDYQQGTIRRDLVTGDNVLRHVVLVNLTIAPRISRLLRPAGQGPAARPEGVTR